MQAMIPFPELSPEIFSISLFGMEFALRWYALAYIFGIILAWRLAATALKSTHLWPGGKAPMQAAQLEDLLTWIILGVILGGRLGFVLFYQPGYYLANPSEILRIWQGGMAFHGGLLGVIIASWLFARQQKIDKLKLADLIAYTVPVGLLLGRLANFINAELWGRTTDLPWGVAFPGQAAQACGQALGEICARHPSQLYEALMEGLVLGVLLLWIVWRRQSFHRPGLTLGLFLAGYGLARFLVEFVRQPDAQFIAPGNPLGLAWQVGDYGLTMGQILSLPMIALGIYFAMKAKPTQGTAE
ncbi:prolipoprotein diacylglyceryl transferase [Roseobacter sp. SK209-2-6]|uniref:prolipoprotein diacylglyceryl transferase n=1 Tax=Roseobacter sp. SK209-2-6 TaxID=388739 RepID=UPI0000F3D65B|nr:prolipoprotein diacylglyceryl transferase [Roseobacter sp. SK209-2-6]EBA15839.1 prolipoprotein diacylglyceryl transferase [Roseobacter sp. SK209-2-6]